MTYNKLTKEEMESAIKKAKNGDLEAFNKIFFSVYPFAIKYINKWTNSDNRDDIRQLVIFALKKTVESYDFGKATLLTYFVWHLKNTVFRYLQENHTVAPPRLIASRAFCKKGEDARTEYEKYKKIDSINHFDGEAKESIVIYPSDEFETSERVEKCLNLIKKPIHRKILEMWAGMNDEKMSLKDIGRTFGISKERARQIKNEAISECRKYGAIYA